MTLPVMAATRYFLLAGAIIIPLSILGLAPPFMMSLLARVIRAPENTIWYVLLRLECCPVPCLLYFMPESTHPHLRLRVCRSFMDGRPFDHHIITDHVLLGRVPRTIGDIQQLKAKVRAFLYLDMQML